MHLAVQLILLQKLKRKTFTRDNVKVRTSEVEPPCDLLRKSREFIVQIVFVYFLHIPNLPLDCLALALEASGQQTEHEDSER
jgi:hypothetical protein